MLYPRKKKNIPSSLLLCNVFEPMLTWHQWDLKIQHYHSGMWLKLVTQHMVAFAFAFAQQLWSSKVLGQFNTRHWSIELIPILKGIFQAEEGSIG